MLHLVDTTIQIHYPRITHVRFEPRYLPRTIRIERIRDLVSEPLTPQEFLRRPYVRRSRYLVLGQEGSRYRQFYLGCSEEFLAPSQLRLALYEPEGEKPVELIGSPFESHVADRKALLRMLEQWQNKSFGDLVLRIYADDLRLVS